MKKNSCTAFVGEIKTVYGGTKKRNILQASDIKFTQSF